MKLFLFLVSLFIGSQTLWATTYYVATNGNNSSGNGSLGQPFATLPRAIEQANPGDIIELRGGNYVSQEIRVNKNNLTIRSYPGEMATLTAVTNIEDVSSCIWYNEPETTGGTLENLEIIGGYYYGIKFESNWDWDNSVPFANRKGVSHITIRNCYIHHTGRDGIKLTPACSNITIENCQISHTGTGPGAALDFNAEGIDNVNAPNMIVRNCYIHNIATTGVYVKGGGRNCLIEKNRIENTGEGGIYLGFYTDAEWFDADFNPNYYENINGTAQNNIIINAQHAGIGLFGAKDAKVWHNTVINAASIDIYAALMLAPSDVWVSDNFTAVPPNTNISIQNNVFTQVANATMPMVRVRENALSGNIVWSNNLFYKENNAAPYFIDDNITWEELSFGQWQSQTGRDSNSLQVNPLIDATGHLQPGSPCIDAGYAIASVTTDFEGQTRTGTPDIGADELGSVTAITQPISNSLTAQMSIYQQNGDNILQVSAPHTAAAQIRICDLSGRHVYQQSIHLVQGKNTLPIPSLPMGIYIVQLPEFRTTLKTLLLGQ